MPPNLVVLYEPVVAVPCPVRVDVRVNGGCARPMKAKAVHKARIRTNKTTQNTVNHGVTTWTIPISADTPDFPGVDGRIVHDPIGAEHDDDSNDRSNRLWLDKETDLMTIVLR